MSRWNKKSVVTVGPKSPVVTTDETIVNHEGGVGYKRDAKSELFLLAVSFMGGDDNFYEKSDARYERLLSLVGKHEVYSDYEWLYGFVGWLRDVVGLRTVSMVIALEAVNARVLAGVTDPVLLDGDPTGVPITNRDLVSVAMSRADEPAEALAYWLATHGRPPIPQPIKNGIGDAAVRLYNQFSFIKYGESRSATVRMIDVLRMTHPKPKNLEQNALFEYITSKDREQSLRHNANELGVVYRRKAMSEVSFANRIDVLSSMSDDDIKRSGMTWETMSEWYPNGMDAYAWERMIPHMGIMALIRNLRNFDQAGISEQAASFVAAKISNPEEVRRSRQLPFRWYNAYRAVESVRWSNALDKALTYSLSNIPKLDGRTLVLVDMSGSMFGSRVSDRSNVTYADVAKLFGGALKLINPDNVDLYQYGSSFDTVSGPQMGMFGRMTWYGTSSGKRYADFTEEERWTGVTKPINLSVGASILRVMDKFQDMGGTETHKAVAETVKPHHDRVILITDEQSWSTNYDNLPIPAGKSLYVWNLGGYEAGVTKSGKFHRHSFGGLTDNAFKLIPMLEAGRNANWPWMNPGANGKTQQNSTK